VMHDLPMLIVCSGEDSYRALEKARELESAFKQKFDPTGSAVERLASGKEGVEALLVAATGGSLFSTRRFFRVDGLLSSCPKARQTALITTLSRDVESTIVVTVEEGELTPKELKPYTSLPKLVTYEFAPLTPAAFLKWANEYGAKVGVKDEAAIKKIADSARGDSWVFVNELQKWRAHPAGSSGSSAALGTTVGGGSEVSVYDVVDRLLIQSPSRWSVVRQFDDANAVVATMTGQARSLLLVQSGYSTGVHPYVAQKLSRLRAPSPSAAYLRLATAFAWSRTSRANADESLDVLG